MATTVPVNHMKPVPTPNPIPAPTLLPPPKPIYQHGLLLRAIEAHKSVVTVCGVQVRDLSLYNPSPDGHTKSPGDLVKGIIDLFGSMDVTAEFYIWHGSPPRGVVVTSIAPSVQRAEVNGPIQLSRIIPSLGLLTPDIMLSDVSITHQNYLYDSNKALGYELDADLLIDSSFGSLSGILSKVLGIEEPKAHIRAALGTHQSWGKPLDLKTLTIEGSFPGYTFAAAPGVQFMSAGVRFTLPHPLSTAATNDAEIFGAIRLTLPGGNVLPLELDYMLKDAGGVVQLTASLPSGATWVNPMGAQGLVLNPATFSSSLPHSDPWKNLKLDVAAELQYQMSSIIFTGSCLPGGTFSIHADMQNFDFASVLQLYEAIHHEQLKTPSVDVAIQTANFSIASGDGFSATLTNVNIAGHGPVNAILNLSSSGCLIHADLGTVEFGDVTVNSAYVELDLQPNSSDKPSNALIHGDIKFELLEADVTVHLYPSAPDVSPKRVEWTVYGELAFSDDTLALSKVEPRLKGTAFDLALTDVVFIAASQADPDIGSVIPDTYKPKEGVQVFATLDQIPAFNKLTKSKVAGIVLEASWSNSAGFALDISLPTPRSISFGGGITTTPINLALDVTQSTTEKDVWIPSLVVSAGLYIPVARCPEPLLFKMILRAAEANVSITAKLKGWWVDPFGISKEVSVGPELLLRADMNDTGLSALFEGGFSIGTTTEDVMVSVSEDPLAEMLRATVNNLNFKDLVAFEEKLLHVNLPPPPSDFLDFENIQMAICPIPLTVGDETYPTGFSFKSDMIFFGKHVDVSCSASETLLTIDGTVDDFSVGPLKVSGMDGAKQAVLKVEVGKDVQHVLVDGAVTLYAETCALHLLVNMHPSPDVSLKIELKFTELLVFEVDAKMIGSINPKDISKSDFTFDADLEQHLLDYIHDELFSLFSRAEQIMDRDIDSAKKKVAAEKGELDDKITLAQQKLQATRDEWEAHQKSVHDTNNKIIQEHNAKIAGLQAKIADAQRVYEAAFSKAQAGLISANHDAQVKVQAAQTDLDNVRKKADADVQNARNRIAAAEANLNRRFGSAEGDINNAEQRVDGLQSQINNVNNQIDRCKRGSWLMKLKIVELEGEKVGLEGTMRIAQGGLELAQAVLRSADYVVDKGVLDAANKALELAQKAGDAVVADAEQALASVQQFTMAVINRATDVLHAVEIGTEKIAFDTAKAGLNAYQQASDVLIKVANGAIADLVKCAEYVAYQTATTALALAKSSTTGLDAAERMLSEVEKGGDEVFDIGKKIINAGEEAFNITSVHVSGSLGKSAGGAHLATEIKGIILKKPFNISADLDPGNVKDFLADIFHQLVHELHLP